MALEDKVLLLVDSHHGIYIPQLFCKGFIDNCLALESNFKELNDSFRECLNPDSEEYFEAWEEIVDSFYWIENGHKFTLIESEDLWAVREDLTEEEQESFLAWN